MITTTDFGTLCDGRTVRLYTLKNDAIELSVTDYCSTLVRLLVRIRWQANGVVSWL